MKVATGEMCQNRIIFKQFIMRGAIDIVQIDACRIGGLNEVLAVLLMAAKYKLPVWPHAGGVGLCEYVQHLSMIDYLVVSGTKEGRVIEYVDHLHEHFIEPCDIRNAAYMPPKRAGLLDRDEAGLDRGARVPRLRGMGMPGAPFKPAHSNVSRARPLLRGERPPFSHRQQIERR